MEKVYLGIASFCIGLIVNSFLPGYLGAKGKNLAEKEDLEEIVEKTEEIKTEFQKEFQDFSVKMDFDYEYCYKQYSELYAQLYAIISQSEYVRYFLNEYEGLGLNTDEIPFIETYIEKNNKDHNNEITKFDKKLIYECIINNAGLASPELLKLAVAYRFANTYYGGSDKRLESEGVKEAFNREELKLIRDIVKRIISEYNILRKVLKLDYSKKELESGLFNPEEWKN